VRDERNPQGFYATRRDILKLAPTLGFLLVACEQPDNNSSRTTSPAERLEAPQIAESQEVTAAKNLWRALTTGSVDDVFNAMQPEHVGNGKTDSTRRQLIQQNINLYRSCANTGYDDQKTTVQPLQNDKVVTLYLGKSCEIPLTGTTMTVRKIVISLGRSADGRYLPKAVPTPMS